MAEYRNPTTGQTVRLVGGKWEETPTISTAGAPAGIRGLVGPESRKPEDRLKTLQKYYPDASAVSGNMVFSDPKTGQPTYYNPPGLDAGDIAEHGRLSAELLGGTGAALAAGASGVGAIGTPLAAAVGAEAGGGLYDAAMSAFTPRVETRTPVDQVGQGVENMAFNLGGEALLKPLVPGLANLMRGRPTAEQQGLRRTFEAEGIPTRGAPGAISGLPSLQSAENTLSQMPTSAKTMAGARDATFDAIHNRVGEVANRYGTPKPRELMGEEIAQSAVDQLKIFDQRASDLTRDMADAIGFDNVVPVNNLTALRDKYTAMLEESPSTFGYLKGPLSDISGFIDEAAEAGGMPVRLINKKRQVIGEELKSPQQSGYTKNQEKAYREIYGASARDIEDAAAGAGPDAQRALELQKRYIRQPQTAQAGTKKSLVNELTAIGNSTGKQAYTKMMDAAKAGPQTLNRMRKSMDMDTWNDFRSTVLDDMGKATPGAQSAAGDAFSANTFLTNWNKVPAASRDVLFGGKEFAGQAASLNKLSKVMESVKSTEKLRNFSNTGAFNMWYNMLTGGATAPAVISGDMVQAVGTVGSMFGLPYATAKLMTNPSFIKFLTEPVKKESGAFANSIARTTARIMQEETDPQIQEDWMEFMSGTQAIMKQARKEGPGAMQ